MAKPMIVSMALRKARRGRWAAEPGRHDHQRCSWRSPNSEQRRSHGPVDVRRLPGVPQALANEPLKHDPAPTSTDGKPDQWSWTWTTPRDQVRAGEGPRRPASSDAAHLRGVGRSSTTRWATWIADQTWGVGPAEVGQRGREPEGGSAPEERLGAVQVHRQPVGGQLHGRRSRADGRDYRMCRNDPRCPTSTTGPRGHRQRGRQVGVLDPGLRQPLSRPQAPSASVCGWAGPIGSAHSSRVSNRTAPWTASTAQIR